MRIKFWDISWRQCLIPVLNRNTCLLDIFVEGVLMTRSRVHSKIVFNERDIIASVEQGEWTSVPHAENLKKRLTQAAADFSDRPERASYDSPGRNPGNTPITGGIPCDRS